MKTIETINRPFDYTVEKLWAEIHTDAEEHNLNLEENEKRNEADFTSALFFILYSQSLHFLIEAIFDYYYL